MAATAQASVEALLSEHLPPGGENNLVTLAAATDTLARRTDKVKANLFTIVKGLYSSTDLAAGAAVACDDSLARLPENVDRVQPELRALAEQHREVDSAMQVSESTITAVREVVVLGATISKYDTQLNKGQFEEAVNSLKEQRAVLARLLDLERAEGVAAGPGGVSSSPVVAGLQADVATRRARLEAQLGELAEAGVLWHHTEGDGGTLTVQDTVLLPGGGGAAPLRAVWAGLRAAGLLERALEGWGAPLQDSALAAALDGGVVATPTESNGAHTLRWQALQPGKRKGGSGEAVAAAARMLQFVCERALCGDPRNVAAFAAALWPLAAEQVVGRWLHAVAPRAPPDVGAFRAAAAHALAVGAAAEKAGVAGAAASLQAAVDSMEAQYAVGRRRQILEQARNLAVMPGYDTLEVGTEEAEAVGAVGAAQEVLLPEGRAALLQFPRCHVSAAASQLAALAAAALHEAVDSGGRREASELCTAVMEAVELFRAVTPVVGAAHLAAAPHLGMLRRNDYHFLAMQLLLLQYQYCGQLTLLLGFPPPLAGLAPALRAAGAAAEEACVAKVEAAVQDCLNDIGPLNVLSVDEEANEAAHGCLQRALHQARCAGSAWRPMLPAEVAERSLGRIYDAICAHIIAAVLQLRDIDVDETTAIQELIKVILEHKAEAPPTAEAEDGTAAGGAPPAPAPAGLPDDIPNWIKLQELAQLLDAKLVDITQRWEEGRLAACGFMAMEVRSLVCAVFETTALRKDCLEKIVDAPEPPAE